MKETHYEPDARAYEHNGYIFKISNDAVLDALNHQGIDILQYVSKALDRWPAGDGKQRVRFQILYDIASDDSWRSNTIKIIKMNEENS